MTCVPTAILKSLRSELKNLGVINLDDLQTFVRTESQKIPMVWVSVNGLLCTLQQQQENRDALANFRSRQEGQLISTFDPLLIFICASTRTRIVHSWKYSTRDFVTKRMSTRSVEIVYSYDGPRSDGQAPRTVHLQSSDRHMWS